MHILLALGLISAFAATLVTAQARYSRGRKIRCPNPPFVECADNILKTTSGSGREKVPSDKSDRNFYWYDIGQVIKYRVKRKFREYIDLVPEAKETVCQADGTWSDPPKCRQHCGPPPVENATCTGADRADGRWNYMTRAVCKCNDGYIRESGFPRPTCGKRNNWNSKLKCKERPPRRRVCKRIPRISHGLCTSNKTSRPFYEGDEVECHCHQGYMFHGSFWEESRVAKCEGYLRGVPLPTGTRRWSNLPRCVKRHVDILPVNCPKPEPVPNASCTEECTGYGQERTFNFGDSFLLQCNEGFTLVGNPRITCSDDGQWNPNPVCRPIGPEPRCIVGNWPGISCEIENGADPDKVPLGYTINCLCDKDDKYKYTIGGTDIICLKENTWSHEPSCTAIKPVQGCYIADVTVHGYGYCVGKEYRSQQFFYNGDQAACSCENKFVFSFHNNVPREHLITCDGTQWTTTSLTCVPQEFNRCAGMPRFENGWCQQQGRFNEKYMFDEGEQIGCQCDTGFELERSGQALVTCKGANSTGNRTNFAAVWNQVPSCKVAPTLVSYDCPAPTDVGEYCGNLKPGYNVGNKLLCRCPGKCTTRHNCRRNGWNRIPSCADVETTRRTTTARTPTTTTIYNFKSSIPCYMASVCNDSTLKVGEFTRCRCPDGKTKRVQCTVSGWTFTCRRWGLWYYGIK